MQWAGVYTPAMDQTENLIEKAALIAKRRTHNAKAGWSTLGDACGVSYVTVRGWAESGHLPLPCLLNFQHYHTQLATYLEDEITAEQFLAWTHEAWRKKFEQRAHK